MKLALLPPNQIVRNLSTRRNLSLSISRRRRKSLSKIVRNLSRSRSRRRNLSNNVRNLSRRRRSRRKKKSLKDC
jgi:hypothetical protein